jgi:hypothetical protein
MSNPDAETKDTSKEEEKQVPKRKGGRRKKKLPTQTVEEVVSVVQLKRGQER